MITIAGGEWIADLGAMTCQNYANKIVVSFEKKGKSITGKLKSIPMALFAKWASEPHGEGKIKKAVMEAEEVFLRAYFENQQPRPEGIGPAFT